MTRRLSFMAVKLFAFAAVFGLCLGFWMEVAAGVRRLVA